MITAKECENLVKVTLSKKRAHHVFCVRDMAVQLAEIYGADKEKAEIAALLHDIQKEAPDEENLQLLMQSDIIHTAVEELPRHILHGPAAAVLSKEKLHITDEEILSAIAWHTTGKEGMSLLDKILYVADKTSTERNYPGVEAFRTLSLQGKLNEALIEIMGDMVNVVLKKSTQEDDTTQRALQYLLREKNGG